MDVTFGNGCKRLRDYICSIPVLEIYSTGKIYFLRFIIHIFFHVCFCQAERQMNQFYSMLIYSLLQRGFIYLIIWNV
jgi:hypothetical protein